MFFMNKGLSPIIATMLLIGIAISIGSVVSIWITSQSQEYMYKEGERRERILNKEGELLTLIHVDFNETTLVLNLTLQNNGTSDLEVAYIKINNRYYLEQSAFCTTPADCELDFNESKTLTIPASEVPSSITRIEHITSLEIGTTLGNLFVYNAPSPAIRITSSFFEYGNILYTFSAEESVDDQKIVEWIWCFHYDETTADWCECRPAADRPSGVDCVAGDCDTYQDCDCIVRACGSGVVASYNYKSYDTVLYPSLVVCLVAVDETGMVGIYTITVPLEIA